MDIKYILKIMIIIFLIFALILYINFIMNSFGINLNAKPATKKLLQTVTIEALKTIPQTQIIMNKEDAFCESHRGNSDVLEESCNKLTRDNCTATSCCVWTSDKKCKAGGQDGPLFNTNAKGKTKQLDYYYFQNECFGEKCVK